MTVNTSFEREWTNAIVDSINSARESSGITVKDLRQRLEQGGWVISDAPLSGMLSGRKCGSISIAEIAVFAWALSVPPMYLMLGLPVTERLPSAPMWDAGATPPQVASWFMGRTSLSPYVGPDAPLDSKSGDEMYTSRLAVQAVEDVMRHASELAVIRWQAAQLIAIDSFEDAEMLERVVHPSVRDQTVLWGAINGLSQARRNQRKFEDGWGVALGPLPEVLEFIDRDEDSEDLTIEQLRTLVTDGMILRAQENFKHFAKQFRETMPEESNGPPTDSAE